MTQVCTSAHGADGKMKHSNFENVETELSEAGPGSHDSYRDTRVSGGSAGNADFRSGLSLCTLCCFKLVI